MKKAKNLIQRLPIELQNLIYEYSGTYRDIMKPVFQHVVQHGNKRELIDTFKYTNYIAAQDNVGRFTLKVSGIYNYEIVCRECFVCSRKRLIFENYHIAFHHVICLQKCKDQFLIDNPLDDLGHETDVFKRDNYYLVYNDYDNE